VTLVVNMLRVSPGATVTEIGWTFGVLDCGTSADALETDAGDDVPPAGALAAPGLPGTLVCEELAGVPPPPPPQPARTAHTKSRP
jgi:hypothetical protein